MALGGGLVGTLYGIGCGMKEVIAELLPPDDERKAAVTRSLCDPGESTGGVS
jgi:hypothetical protein